jgi:cubilin
MKKHDLKKIIQMVEIKNFIIVCGGEFSSPNGIITSPYHPNPYPSNRQCAYLISQPPGTLIRLQFIAFDIEGSYDCQVNTLLHFRDCSKTLEMFPFQS